jgi:hypothetical protein
MTDDHNDDHEADQSAQASTLVEDPTPPTPAEDPDEALANPEVTEPLTEKIRFAWRSSDESILTRIELAAETQFAELFADSLIVVDNLYSALRVPDGQGGWVMYGNRPFEDWDQLTGQDLERAIMDLMRIKMIVAPAVNKLKSRAVYAKMTADDTKDASYKKVVSGTIGDRTARANRDSQQDRYHAFFNYHLWSVADVFLQQIVDLMFRLRDVRNWRISAQR